MKSTFDPILCSYSSGEVKANILVGKETLTVQLNNGKEMKLDDVVVGCTSSLNADLDGADGLLGLGISPGSFVSRNSKKFGDKFSHCWVDIMNPSNDSKSYLIFGNTSTISPLANMQYTELGFGGKTPYYTLRVLGISLDGVMLNIPSQLWYNTDECATALDSGSTLTVLRKPVYDIVMTAFKAHLSKFERVKSSSKFTAELPNIVEYCFDATGFDESIVPKLAFHFNDGARFAPPVRNYVIESEPGVRCLGFYPSTWFNDVAYNIIGNIMQQGYHWEFDLAIKKLGFAPSTCA